MFKKIFLSICLIAIIAYLSLWAWAVRWIDEEKNIVDFVSEDKNITLEIAKTVWKITPAINREKDAQRLLKISNLYLYTNLKNNTTRLNYNFISKYYKQNEKKLNNQLKNKFILQKLIIMNRSFKRIEDNEFEKEIHNIIIADEFYNSNDIETRLEWIPEILWFIFWHDDMYDLDKFKNTFEKYNNYFISDLLHMKSKYNTNSFDNIVLYHTASYICYESNFYKSKDKSLKADKISKDMFVLLQERITPNSQEYKIMNELMTENANFLIIYPIVFFDSEFECRREAMNFLSKMNEIAKVLDEENVVSKLLQSNSLSKRVFD